MTEFEGPQDDMPAGSGLNRRQVVGRGIGIAGGLAVGGSLLAACGRSDESDSGGGDSGGEGGGGTVKIGFITAVSGPASTYFPSVEQISNLAVDELNEAGGVLGSKVELMIADSATNPQTSSTEARRLLQEGVKFVLQLDVASARDASIDVIKTADIPYSYAWDGEGGAGESNVCQRNVWEGGLVPAGTVTEPMKFLVGERGVKKWAMLGNDYQWPHTMSEFATKVIEESGGEVVAEEFAPLGTTDFGAIITKLRALGDDVGIVNTLVGADTVAFYKQWQPAGGNNENNIAFSFDEQQLAACGKTAEGVMGAYTYFTTLDTPGNKAIIEKLEKKFGSKAIKPTALSIHPYDVIHLWALAAEKAKSFDLKAISDAYPTVTFDGPRGPVGFHENHHMSLPLFLAAAGPDGLFVDYLKEWPATPMPDQCDQSIYDL